MVKIDTRGCTRTVVLIGKYALKFPCLHHNYKLFIAGITANLNEGNFMGLPNSVPIAKTLYSNRFGLLNIQERVRRVEHRGLFAAEIHKVLTDKTLAPDFYLSDLKPENFGYNSRNELVKLDYGN